MMTICMPMQPGMQIVSGQPVQCSLVQDEVSMCPISLNAAPTTPVGLFSPIRIPLFEDVLEGGIIEK